MKRIGRFLDNPHLDETAVFVRWLKLSYHFGADPPQNPTERPLVPLLLDTVYFNPFAMLVCTVPCGSRGLPVALTTYHRQELAACFPPRHLAVPGRPSEPAAAPPRALRLPTDASPVPSSGESAPRAADPLPESEPD